LVQGIERRKYKRIRRNLIIRFRALKKAVKKKRDKEWNMAITENLSADGALFKYSSKLKIDSEHEMKIKFPRGRTPVECSCKVVRVETLQEAPIFRIAVRYLKMSKKNKGMIDKFAKQYGD